MQLPALKNDEEIKMFRATLSEARFARYLKDVGDDSKKAIRLYSYNTELSKTLYSTLQMWEVALRNRLNSFLCWKFHAGWPHDQKRALRQLTSSERRRVTESISRQQQLRNIKNVPIGAIVADLSAGFWVALLNSSYDIPFSWRYNLGRIFPGDTGLTRETASGLCNSLLDLRNRVAHHEPIYHLPLSDRRNDLTKLLGAMCAASRAYADVTCNLGEILKLNPVASPKN
jgi:Abi-like protein